MSDIEKKARELLDSALEREVARKPRLIHMEDALHAIIAALTPQDGWVLVPVIPSSEMDARGKAALSDNGVDLVEDSDALVCYAAMLNARPSP